VSARGFVTRAIVELDPLSGFSCGVPALDLFFTGHALTNERREFSKTFVLAAPDGVRIPATHVRAPGDGERLAPVMTRERLARLR
jgi:hypothetical protein